MIPHSFDVLGNIAILKFEKGVKKSAKVEVARELLKEHQSITTVLEKKGKFKGRLRKMETSYLAGEKTKVAIYRENGCIFRFNIDTTYFSPRLSNERNEIAKQVKQGENVLVLFAGVAPFSIVIAKMANPKRVYSVEINKEGSRYAAENIKINKMENIVEVIQGDVKKVIPKFSAKKIKFDRIVMPRPQLKDTFLESAFKVIKNKGIINYYGFSKDPDEIVDSINKEAKKAKKKIDIILVKKAGEIAPFRYRWRVDLRVLN